jgi:hypothetical protein
MEEDKPKKTPPMHPFFDAFPRMVKPCANSDEGEGKEDAEHIPCAMFTDQTPDERTEKWMAERVKDPAQAHEIDKFIVWTCIRLKMLEEARELWATVQFYKGCNIPYYKWTPFDERDQLQRIDAELDRHGRTAPKWKEATEEDTDIPKGALLSMRTVEEKKPEWDHYVGHALLQHKNRRFHYPLLTPDTADDLAERQKQSLRMLQKPGKQWMLRLMRGKILCYQELWFGQMVYRAANA